MWGSSNGRSSPARERIVPPPSSGESSVGVFGAAPGRSPPSLPPRQRGVGCYNSATFLAELPAIDFGDTTRMRLTGHGHEGRLGFAQRDSGPNERYLSGTPVAAPQEEPIPPDGSPVPEATAKQQPQGVSLY